MTPKEEYSQFCLQQPSMPIFMQPWWMDAVCAGKQWDVILVKKPDGTIMAAMPYLIRQRLRFRYILMPQQTQIGGVWIAENYQHSETSFITIANDIKRQLKELHLSYYYQHFPISSPMPELLHQQSFSIKRRTTYRVEYDHLQDLDALLASFSKNKKRQLQKALTLNHDTNFSAEDFYRFHCDCLKEQGKKINYSREFFLVLYQKTQRLSQSCILRVLTADGAVAAAAFLVWDKKTMYYLIPCYSPAYKDSGASALLVWEALKMARDKQLSFDFEGSMHRGTANHYRQFGSLPVNYFAVQKYYNPLFAIALFLNKFR